MAKVYGQVPGFGLSGWVTEPEKYATETSFATYHFDVYSPRYGYEGTGFVYDVAEPEESWELPTYTLIDGRVYSASEYVVGMHHGGHYYLIESEEGWSVEELRERRDDADFEAWILSGDDEAESQQDFEGFDGNDTIAYEVFNPFLTGAGVRLSGGAGDDTITGGHPVLNVLEGGEGNDHLIGRPASEEASGVGRDEMHGGPGDDRLEGWLHDDLLDGGEGVDVAYYRNSAEPVTVNLATGEATGGEAEGDEFVSIENIHGSTHADRLTGDDGVNLIVAEDGDDIVNGLGGVDSLVGNGGNDTLDGGAGADFMYGGAGDDAYHVDDTFDLVDEGAVFPELGGLVSDHDTIISTAGWYWDVYSAAETLQAAEGADVQTLVHSAFSGQLIGNADDNLLFGRGGSDIYRPGGGVDYISFSTLGLTEENAYAGVDGVNTLVMEVGNSYDIVFEFESGKDKVDLTAFGVSIDALFDRGADDGLGNSYFALGDGTDYLYMIGLELSELSAGDFIV